MIVASRRQDVVGEIAKRRAADLAVELAGVSLATLERAAAAAPPPREVAIRLAAPGLALIAEVKRVVAVGRPDRRSVGRPDRPGPGVRGGRRGGDLGPVRAALVRWLGRRPAAGSGRRSACPSWPRSSWSTAASCRCCGPPGPTWSCSWPACIRLRAWGAWSTTALDLGLEPLVEAHDRRELDRALADQAPA